MQLFNKPCITRISQGQYCIKGCTVLEPCLGLVFLMLAAERNLEKSGLFLCEQMGFCSKVGICMKYSTKLPLSSGQN